MPKMPRQQWHPPDYDKNVARALQSFEAYSRGDGEEPPPPSPRDAAIALEWIIKTAAGTYEEPFRPGSQDEVNYMLGRRSVGLAIVKMLTIKPEIIK